MFFFQCVYFSLKVGKRTFLLDGLLQKMFYFKRSREAFFRWCLLPSSVFLFLGKILIPLVPLTSLLASFWNRELCTEPGNTKTSFWQINSVNKNGFRCALKQFPELNFIENLVSRNCNVFPLYTKFCCNILQLF